MNKLLIAICASLVSLFATAAEIRGVFPILSAPYEEDGALDIETLVREARFVADAGVDGFIWCQSNDAIDLLTPAEKKASFAALAKAFAGEDIWVTLGCEGRDTAEMVELAEEVERLAAQYPTTKLAIISRPPHDARTGEDLARYYRTLGKIAKRPVIIQTYTSDTVPIVPSDLMIRLAEEFPKVFGWIKEETGGEDANERMRKECTSPVIKTVFSAWGSYGWLDQYRNYGTRGLISERAAYADYLMEIWKALEDGNGARADELWAQYLLTMNLKETIPGGHLRGFNLYILKKRGIFKNYVSRDYADKEKTPGKWKLDTREFSPAEIAEIEDRWQKMSALIPKRTFVSKIKVNPEERWFGSAVNLGRYQPWTAKSNTRDIDYEVPDYDLEFGCWGGGVMPFLVSDQGRYVWSDGPFSFRSTNGVLRVESHLEKVKVVQAGRTLKDAYLAGSSKHFKFTGKTPPAEFFTKPQFNNWIEIFLHGVNQDVSEKYVKDLAASGFPCGVFMTDGGWMKYHGAERFDDLKFPDPVRYFDLIRAQGWKSILWMSPFVSPDSQREYRQLRYYPHEGVPGSGYAKGLDYLICEKGSKRPAILRWWSGNSAAYDLTNPKAFEYFVARLKKFASDYHFDGFKFDAGDPVFIPEGADFYRPDTPRCEFGRAYNLLGTRIPYNEFRSGFGTGGQPIVQRLHDQPHSWKALQEIIKSMINAGLVGYPYTVADMIGGGACGSYFPGKPFSPKLMVRSCQLQALMPMMQFSLAPWRVLDEVHCNICRDYAQLHCEFGPYIMTWAEHAARTGEPILRSMDYEFPGQGFGDCFTQFMLGPDWLVAPVITEDDAVTVRLPSGRWRDDLGELHVGPKTLALKAVPLTRLPRFHREAQEKFKRTEDFSAIEIGPRRRLAKETLLFAEFQVKYGVFHDYLHEWIDRPLFWDRALRPDTFQYETQDSLAIHAREMRNAGLDGLNMFALKGRTKDISKFRDWLNGRGFADFSILPTLGYGDDGQRRADISTFVEALTIAKADPTFPRINGKLIVPTYNYRMFKPDEHKEIIGKLEEQLGKGTFSICGDIDGGLVYELQQAFKKNGKLTDAEQAKLEQGLRDVLAVADGVQVTVAGYERPYDGQYGTLYDLSFFDACLVPAFEKVYAQPEFAKKILGFYVLQGYVNHMSGNVNSEEGTGTLRRFLKSVTRTNPDYLMFFEWNEVNENTMFQPTVRGGRTAPRIMKWYSWLLKGQTPEPYADDDTSVPPLALSYRAVVKPGEELHFEILNIPDGVYKKEMKVQLELCRNDGSTVTEFPVETMKAGRFGVIDYQVDTVKFSGTETLIPALKVNGRRFEGFVPVRVDPTVAWNYKAYRQSLRDLAAPSVAQVSVTTRPNGEYAFACKAKFPEKLASLELIGNEEELTAMGIEKEYDFAANNIVLVQVSTPRPGAGYGQLEVKVNGAKGCTFIPRYRANINSGIPVVNAEASGFKVTTLYWASRVGYYVQIPKSCPIDQVTLEVSRPDKKGWQTAKFPLARLMKEGAIGGILNEETSFRVDVNRVMNLPDLPPHLKVSEVDWKGTVATATRYPVFHFRAILENGKVWRSRPFRPNMPTGPKTRLPVFDEYGKGPSQTFVSEALIPKLEYAFDPTSGAMLRSGWTPFFDGWLGAGHWYCEPFSDPRIVVKPGGRAPKWVKDGGRDALEFDGENDYVDFPKEAFPQGAFTLTMEVKPQLPTNDVPMVLFRHFDFIRGSISLYIDRGELVAVWGDRNLAREPKIKTGLKVMEGVWSRVTVSYDFRTFRFAVDGQQYEFPWEGRPFRFKPSVFGGHDKLELTPRHPVKPVYFRGRLRQLSIRHSAP